MTVTGSNSSVPTALGLRTGLRHSFAPQHSIGPLRSSARMQLCVSPSANPRVSPALTLTFIGDENVLFAFVSSGVMVCDELSPQHHSSLFESPQVELLDVAM